MQKQISQVTFDLFRKISEEKSMNHKFLGQIFQEKDFSEDYLFFLNHFDNIMEQDNDRKVKCLAELLTDPEGKVKSVDMVRRLPWTRTILNKVAKISRELLKHSPNTQWSHNQPIYKANRPRKLFSLLPFWKLHYQRLLNSCRNSI